MLAMAIGKKLKSISLPTNKKLLMHYKAMATITHTNKKATAAAMEVTAQIRMVKTMGLAV